MSLDLDPKFIRICENILSLLKRLDDEIGREAFEEAKNALETLHKLQDVTIAVLARTKVGVRVAKLQTHSHAGLSALAKECVKDWKNMASTQQKPIPNSSLSTSQSSSAPSTSSIISSSNVITAKSSGQDEIRHAFDSSRADAHALPLGIKLSDSRRRVQEMLRKILLEVINLHVKTEQGIAQTKSLNFDVSLRGLETSTNSVASDIEQALFDALGGGNDERPSNAYGEQFKALAFNFKRNVALTVNILYGIVPPQQLVTMTSAELLSEEAKKSAEEAVKQAVEATQADWDRKNRAAVLAKAGIDPAEGMLTCPKCKKRNTNFYLKQTRSADEPMTTFANCLTDTCLYRWRF